MSKIKAATGYARYDSKTGILKITTIVKRGKKEVEHTTLYRVHNINPDPRVAEPAFSLTKGEVKLTPGLFKEGGEMPETPIFTPSPTAEVYHVAIEQFGPTCSCPHATFRGQNSSSVCKHVVAMRAVGLLPKGNN